MYQCVYMIIRLCIFAMFVFAYCFFRLISLALQKFLLEHLCNSMLVPHRIVHAKRLNIFAKTRMI